MARRKAPRGTPATDALIAAGVAFEPVEYAHHDDATDFGAEVTRETGLDAAVVFKTLVVSTGPRQLAVGVVPVAGRLDLKALAAALGVKKVEMAEPKVAERSSGYVVGGLSPLGQRTPLPTVIDSSAEGLDRLYVSGGKRGLQVGLAPADLAAVTGATFAPIAREG
ncbi:Cys-tRNA(Pro) deacylase [Propioniciclava sinopodophylli]|uniref:Cys-tRNA(Pro) deacylase n=1 Tax=Propioniciclava sinopodophylli TaxID=1837344 RepID=UPI00248FDA18|nr:Cys-tRNA(Pro) deacylase [Propioniciclava sinopodophylli]